MSTLRVRLLGAATATTDVASYPFTPDKRYQLLSYLAYQNDWVGREQLLYLFWSDSSSELARNNLRQLLKRVRDLEWVTGLETNGQHLRWRVTSDVMAFKEALSKTQWAEALGHYGGPLLEGLTGDESPEFLNWLELERERIHDSWRMAVHRRAEELEREGWYLEAANLLESLLEGDDLDEEALKVYMKVMVRAGGREGALKAYQDFATRLQEEMDLTPTSELEGLAKAIREGEFNPNPISVIDATLGQKLQDQRFQSQENLSVSLPTMNSTFIGRDLELAEVAEMLAQPDCRLLTLTGVGGVGKTRIAVQVAAQQSPNYPDGVFFAPLEALNSSTLVPFAIADALHLRLEGPDEAISQVTRHIGKKRLLLVLDNFEHLWDGAPIASELLQQCSNLRLLITSRESLNLSEEWRFPVGGLSYPTSASVSLEESQYFDAVRLFVQRIKQVQHGFALSEADLPFVLQICQRLEGSALGLELAAVWTKSLPLSDIVQEISSNLDFLASSSRNASKRHQSIRAVFDYSWQLLTPTEQAVLRKLSVFVGGFSREAARHVADASLPVLAALVDKSLLRLRANGRYTCHLLVNQYAGEKLAEGPHEKAQSEEKHALYYLGFVQEQTSELHTKGRKTARDLLEEDLDNIRAAWGWAVRGANVDLLKRVAFAMSEVFEGRRQEGLGLFSEAVATLDAANPRHHTALGYLLVGQAEQEEFQLFDCGALSVLLERALSFLKPLREERAMAKALRILADCQTTVGNFARAKTMLQEALLIAREHGTPTEIAHTLCDLALAERHASSSEADTKRFMVAALSEMRTLGALNHLAFLLLIYGAYLIYQNQLPEGEALLEESLRLAKELGGDQDFMVYILLDLARTAQKRAPFDPAAFDRAETLLQEALRRASQKNRHAESAALSLLGRVANARHNVAEAQEYFKRSLQMAWQYEQWLTISATLVFVAEMVVQSAPLKAVELLVLVLGQTALEKRDRDEAQRLLDALKTQLSPKDFKEAVTRGEALTLEATVSQVVAGSYAPLSSPHSTPKRSKKR